MLQVTADWWVYSFFKISPDSRWGAILNFFIYDSMKILLLLFIMISVIGFLRTFLPADKMKAWLGKGEGLGNFVAALFGAVTPFCSCSSIPIFFGFLKAQLPLGIAFSFLITSPLVNEYLVVLMIGFFGWKITVLYVTSGIAIGVFVGMILGRMRLERFVVPDFFVPRDEKNKMVFGGMIDRVWFGLKEAIGIIDKLWVWILVGVAIGAVIHNEVPEAMIHSILRRTGNFSVPIATVLGAPLYGSCAAIVPVAVVLFQKGVPLGTALSFMMAIAALSLPEAVMLRRAMRIQLIGLFFGVTTLGIILTGYIFNFLQVVLF